MEKLLSIIIAAYNEENTITILLDEILDVLDQYNLEILVIDDGSTDGTNQLLREYITSHKDQIDKIIKLVELRRNSGQTAAMKAGFDHVTGDLVVTLDADGQNDPADIPKLIETLQENRADVVCGWRRKRKDTFGKRIFSKFSNWLRRFLTGLEIHDSGCTLRVYQRDAIENLGIWGEDHRYIPQIIYSNGFKVIEMEVNHRERIAGKSKYGLARLFRGGLDLLSITFVSKLAIKPLHFFTIIALPFILIGTTILGYLSFIRLVDGEAIGDRPLLLLGALLEIVGLQIFLSGLTNELIAVVRMRDEKKYSVREIIS